MGFLLESRYYTKAAPSCCQGSATGLGQRGNFSAAPPRSAPFSGRGGALTSSAPFLAHVAPFTYFAHKMVSRTTFLTKMFTRN